MDAQEAPPEITSVAQVQPVPEGEHRFNQAIAKGAFAGLFLGAAMGLAICIAARVLMHVLDAAQMAGIIVGTLAGGVFLGVSVMCGLHTEDIVEH